MGWECAVNMVMSQVWPTFSWLCLNFGSVSANEEKTSKSIGQYLFMALPLRSIIKLRLPSSFSMIDYMNKAMV